MARLVSHTHSILSLTHLTTECYAGKQLTHRVKQEGTSGLTAKLVKFIHYQLKTIQPLLESLPPGLSKMKPRDFWSILTS